jgi:hypothetical protein
MPVRFLLLMRHAARDKIKAQATDVGQGLSDYIKETRVAKPLALKLGLCLHPAKGHGEETARELIKALAVELEATSWFHPKQHTDLLDPHELTANPYLGRTDCGARCDQIEAQADLIRRIVREGERPDCNAVLVIGHSPQVDWLLHRLIIPPNPWRRLPWYQPAFAAAEIICVELDQDPSSEPRGRVIWSLAPRDEETEKQLREKIRGKMESAKLLGGIVAAGIGFALGGFHDLAFGWSSMMDDVARGLQHKVDALDTERVVFFGLAISALLFATGLYCFAYLSYDRLLMPTRFWAAGNPPDYHRRGIVWRPPSSSLLVMHQNMQRVWFRAFIPATLFTGIALVFLGHAAMIQQLADTLHNVWVAWGCYWGVVVVLGIGLWHWRRWAEPLLGAQD